MENLGLCRRFKAIVHFHGNIGLCLYVSSAPDCPESRPAVCVCMLLSNNSSNMSSTVCVSMLVNVVSSNREVCTEEEDRNVESGDSFSLNSKMSHVCHVTHRAAYDWDPRRTLNKTVIKWCILGLIIERCILGLIIERCILGLIIERCILGLIIERCILELVIERCILGLTGQESLSQRTLSSLWLLYLCQNFPSLCYCLRPESCQKSVLRCFPPRGHERSGCEILSASVLLQFIPQSLCLLWYCWKEPMIVASVSHWKTTEVRLCSYMPRSASELAAVWTSCVSTAHALWQGFTSLTDNTGPSSSPVCTVWMDWTTWLLGNGISSGSICQATVLVFRGLCLLSCGFICSLVCCYALIYSDCAVSRISLVHSPMVCVLFCAELWLLWWVHGEKMRSTWFVMRGNVCAFHSCAQNIITWCLRLSFHDNLGLFNSLGTRYSSILPSNTSLYTNICSLLSFLLVTIIHSLESHLIDPSLEKSTPFLCLLSSVLALLVSTHYYSMTLALLVLGHISQLLVPFL